MPTVTIELSRGEPHFETLRDARTSRAPTQKVMNGYQYERGSPSSIAWCALLVGKSPVRLKALKGSTLERRFLSNEETRDALRLGDALELSGDDFSSRHRGNRITGVVTQVVAVMADGARWSHRRKVTLELCASPEEAYAWSKCFRTLAVLEARGNGVKPGVSSLPPDLVERLTILSLEYGLDLVRVALDGVAESPELDDPLNENLVMGPPPRSLRALAAAFPIDGWRDEDEGEPGWGSWRND